MYDELKKIAENDMSTFLNDYTHLLKPGLIGAGVGGLGALGLSAAQEPEERRWVRNMLLGLMLGGGAGVGVSAGLPHIQPLLSRFKLDQASPDKDTQPDLITTDTEA